MMIQVITTTNKINTVVISMGGLSAQYECYDEALDSDDGHNAHDSKHTSIYSEHRIIKW